MSNLYILCGEEKFLIEEEKNKIIKNVLGIDIENKVSIYNMLQHSIDDVLEDARTISLFMTKKVIVCYNCYFLTKSSNMDDDSQLEHFIKYLDKIENDVIIILIVNDKLDERKKITKQLRQKAVVKEFNKVKVNDLDLYARNLFKEHNYDIDYKTIRLLIDRIENDMGILSQEINKLMLYKKDDKKIISSDIEELVCRPIVDNVFELIDAVIKKDIRKIFDLYNRLLFQGEEPIKIIVILANQFRLIYQVKRLKKLGYTENDIISRLRIHPYRIKLASEVKLDEQILLTYIDRLANLDIDIKMGKINKDMGLELFFLSL